MKRIVLIMLVALLAAPAFGITPIGRGPGYDSRFWNWPGGAGLRWMGDIEELVEAGAGIGTGNIFYVDSGVVAAGDGSNWLNAKATLDEAVGLCTADNGDIILIAQGHTEAMGVGSAAAGTGDDVVDIDVAGVTVIGCGKGMLAPLFDYTGDVTGSFAIGADDVTLVNVNFCANITDVNDAIEVEAGCEQVTIANCIFYCNAENTDDFLECIDSSGAASNRLTVVGCQFNMGAGACNSGIYMKDSNYALIANNVFHGDYAVACLNQVTTASDHIVIKNNLMFNGTIGGDAGMNAQPCIEVAGDTTGMIIENYFVANGAALTNSVVAADMFLFENYTSEDEDSGNSGALVGAASVAE